MLRVYYADSPISLQILMNSLFAVICSFPHRICPLLDSCLYLVLEEDYLLLLEGRNLKLIDMMVETDDERINLFYVSDTPYRKPQSGVTLKADLPFGHVSPNTTFFFLSFRFRGSSFQSPG